MGSAVFKTVVAVREHGYVGSTPIRPRHLYIKRPLPRVASTFHPRFRYLPFKSFNLILITSLNIPIESRIGWMRELAL